MAYSFINKAKGIFKADYRTLLQYTNAGWFRLSKNFGCRVRRIDSDVLFVDFGVCRTDLNKIGNRIFLQLTLSKDNTGNLIVKKQFLNSAEIAITNKLIAVLGLFITLKTVHGVLKYNQFHNDFVNVDIQSIIAKRDADGFFWHC